MILGDLHKTKQFFWLILKLTLVIGCVYFIYLRLTQNENFSLNEFWNTLLGKQFFSIKNLSILIGFSLINWILEILKWQSLVSSIQKIDFFEAAKQSLSSLTSSLITPNRIGEYGAKILYFKPEFRSRVLLLNLFGNLSQLFATLLFGSLGFLYLNTISNDFKSFQYSLYAAMGIVIVGGVLYFIITKNKTTYKGYSWQKITSFAKALPKKILILNVLFGCLRYLFFSHQFVFLLDLFEIDIPYLIAISCVGLMYLVASIIPMLSLFDVVLKSSVAIAIFGHFTQNELGVLMVSLVMWLLNFAIPSLFGSYFVLTFKTKK
ncbi:hypothetical protein GCM10011416_12840 [Polaribacter pacificus]|uniref:Lysylphosphatidylglycerol synthase TM region n=1 Tax=Polaribacter pacificus TaxID=1775173 RepID=A0A917MCT3_9FLAO|nr:hypothetical protein GCM10011416_12840 [Polaribacter pacificus]